MSDFWDGFYSLANGLISGDIECSEDTIFRSAVNRFYYYSFHNMKNILIERKFIPEKMDRSGQHELVERTLNSNILQLLNNPSDAKKFATSYGYLKNMRSKCDYDRCIKEGLDNINYAEEFKTLSKRALVCKEYFPNL